MTLVDVDLEMEKSEGAVEEEPVVATIKTTTKNVPTTLTAADLPSIHTDPFAAREGKTLTWKNINMTLVRQIVYLPYFPLQLLTSLIPFLSQTPSLKNKGGER